MYNKDSSKNTNVLSEVTWFTFQMFVYLNIKLSMICTQEQKHHEAKYRWFLSRFTARYELLKE